jgi:membrane protein YdbS with pleckstrin-like domain
MSTDAWEFIPGWLGWGFDLDGRGEKEKVKKASDIVQDLYHLLSFVQWVIAVIFLPGTTIIVVVIMPAIDLLVAFLVGLMITLIVVFMAIFYNFEKKRTAIAKDMLDI